MNNKMEIKTAFLILGAVIGAGLASGREIVTFFLDYGILSYFLIVIMALLIFSIIYIFLRVGRFIKPKNISDITKIIFKKYSKPIDLIMLLALFFAVFAMLAGADALFSGSFVNYSFPYASITLALAVIVVVSGGLKNLLKASSVIVPIVISFLIIISLSFLMFGNTGSPTLNTQFDFANISKGFFR